VLASVVAHIITNPSARNVRGFLAPLSILLALWVVRTLTHWLQARLGQRGATAIIADLNGQVLEAVTGRQPDELAAQRDDAAVVVTYGLDGLRPYFTGYLPTLLLAAILTPATVVVIALYDLKSAVLVVITLPLIPVFMVLIGLATAERSAAALAAMTTLQARLLDLIAGIPTLRALGRARGPSAASPNSVPPIGVRRWPRCGSPSCRRWCWNCWPRWAWRWSRSASDFAWCPAR